MGCLDDLGVRKESAHPMFVSFRLLAFLFCLAMVIWECAEVFRDYHERPYKTEVTIEENQTLAMPNLLICSKQWMNRDSAKKWKVDDELAEFMMSGFVDTEGFRKNNEVRQLFYFFCFFFVYLLLNWTKEVKF